MFYIIKSLASPNHFLSFYHFNTNPILGLSASTYLHHCGLTNSRFLLEVKLNVREVKHMNHSQDLDAKATYIYVLRPLWHCKFTCIYFGFDVR